jgi:hypothetical protein
MIVIISLILDFIILLFDLIILFFDLLFQFDDDTGILVSHNAGLLVFVDPEDDECKNWGTEKEDHSCDEADFNYSRVHEIKIVRVSVVDL